jgi:hypothetical protein
MTNQDDSMAHAQNTLAQLRKADRNDIDPEDAIHDQHATILEQLATQIAKARSNLNAPYQAPLKDVEAALREGAAVARRGEVEDEGDLREAMLLSDYSVPGEES